MVAAAVLVAQFVVVENGLAVDPEPAQQECCAEAGRWTESITRRASERHQPIGLIEIPPLPAGLIWNPRPPLSELKSGLQAGKPSGN